MENAPGSSTRPPAAREVDPTTLAPARLPGLPARPVDLIVIHCAATPSGQPLQQGRPGERAYRNAADVIDGWHAKRGFHRALTARLAFNPTLPAIGYHYVIDLDGTVFTGRHLDEVPAQAAGFNARAVGICLVGGAEPTGRYTPAQWRSLATLSAFLLAHYGLPAAAPLRRDDASADMGYRVYGGICGHRDLSPDLNGDHQVQPREWLKTCPGFDVSAWIKRGMRPAPEHVFEGV